MGGRVSGGLEVEGVERGQKSRDEHLAGSSQSHFTKAEDDKATGDETDDDEGGEGSGHGLVSEVQRGTKARTRERENPRARKGSAGMVEQGRKEGVRVGSGAADESVSQPSVDGSIVLTEYARVLIGMKVGEGSGVA